MASSTRVRLVEAIGGLLKFQPHVRFGQLVSNLASLVEMAPEAIWTVQDAPLLTEASDLLATLRSRGEDGECGTGESRETLLKLIADLGDVHPGVPFGKLVANLAGLARLSMSTTELSANTWEVEDDELVALFSRFGEGVRPPLIAWESTLPHERESDYREWVSLLTYAGQKAAALRSRRGDEPANAATRWGEEDDAVLDAIRALLDRRDRDEPVAGHRWPLVVIPEVPILSHG